MKSHYFDYFNLVRPQSCFDSSEFEDFALIDRLSAVNIRVADNPKELHSVEITRCIELIL
jgi:hypothetical protein